jgi:glycosyltransferase involved in cell wall biosynthesis
MFWLLAEELVLLGHQVEAITSDSLGPDERVSASVADLGRGITVRRFRNRHNRLAAHLPPLFLRPRGLRRGLRDALFRADVVHMGESRHILNLWAAQAAERAGVPLVWSAYGGLPTARGVRGVYRRLHDVFLTSRVVPRVSAFIAQTAHEEAIYRAHGVDDSRIHRIPLCVDIKTFAQLPARGSLRRRLGLPEAAQLVVSVARLSPLKGLDLLVEAFSHLPAGERGPHLALIGWDHGALVALRSLVKKKGLEARVHFPGPLYDAERLTAYVDADLFSLTPRVFEETSLAGLEAAAAGCPTVLSAECEIPGLAEAGGGLLVTKAAPTLARGIADLLSDESRRKRMGAIAYAYVRENFSAAAVAAKHEQLFRQVIHPSVQE